MTVSDLDLLAQSVRRALDRIDGLEADKRRLLTDMSVLETRLKDSGDGGRSSSSRISGLEEVPGRTAEVRARLEGLVAKLRDLEKQL